MNKFAWMDTGKYVNHAAPRLCFAVANGRAVFEREMAKRYFEIVSEPKKLKIYEAPHALNAEAHARSHRFSCGAAFLQAPGTAAIAAIPL